MLHFYIIILISRKSVCVHVCVRVCACVCKEGKGEVLVCHFIQLAGSRKKREKLNLLKIFYWDTDTRQSREESDCVYIERGRSDGKEPIGLIFNRRKENPLIMAQYRTWIIRNAHWIA